ncbi:toll/interleukin-1 receptor domain-containing protein [Priestia flexa]|uniref:toll/interleukin-1 receptor domain-containing protein n=1 Tax=Priestia flexa TaxID=86664 RepID=UPI0020A117EA|nr:toll/interleukin-1 receptor domain-containing protein [Priestia flexa]MCP1190837.1 toll/interleukin-1 receptor domain-containing protein [Priestia flexa]
MPVQKIFISHDPSDMKIINELVDFLEFIGVNNSKIFCSSLNGYGIPLGENFLDRIKRELIDEVIVLFVLTENFYKNPICMCEMGATWIQAKHYIPIVVPPFTFEDIRGNIRLSQGLIINKAEGLNSLFDELRVKLDLPLLKFNIWERKRDRFINIVNKHISSQTKSKTSPNNFISREKQNTNTNKEISLNDSYDKLSITPKTENFLFMEDKNDLDEIPFIYEQLFIKSNNKLAKITNLNSDISEKPINLTHNKSDLEEHNFIFENFFGNSKDGLTKLTKQEFKNHHSENFSKSPIATISGKDNKVKSYYEIPENLLRFMTLHFKNNEWFTLDLLREKLKPVSNTNLDIVELLHVLYELKFSKKIKFRKFNSHGIQLKLTKEAFNLKNVNR